MIRIPLESATVPGFARALTAEELDYHAPVPDVTRALVIRSEHADRFAAWETAPVPNDLVFTDTVAFVVLAAIEATDDRREFTLAIDGLPVLTITNPRTAREGVLEWTGDDGVRAELHVTLVDRYSDAMGFLFVHVPRRFLRPGEPLRFELRGETAGTRTWCMIFERSVSPEITVRPVPAVVRAPGGPLQELRVDIVRLDEGGPVTLDSPAGQAEAMTTLGHTRLLLETPAVDRRTSVSIAFELENERHEAAVEVEPVEPLTIWLIHHTHLDIGYTHLQDEVERLQWSHLEEALRLGKDSESLPAEARFVWHPEGIWAVETYLEQHGAEENARLLEGIRRGWIHLDALHTNLLTGIMTGEGLIRALEPAQRLADRTGVPIRSAMFTDIPGFSWGLIPVFAAAGVRYFSVGPNRGHRIGSFLSTWGDRPFWWESPSGRERVLVWVHGEGYSLFHTGLGYEQLDKRLDVDLVLGAVESLRNRGWSHPIAALRYNIGSDNGPPDPTLSATVRDWNERYVSPRIVIGSSEQVLAELESSCGDELPVVHGDLTGYWEDGAASSARETQSIRHTVEWLSAAEALAAMSGVELDPEEVYLTWREVLLYCEHTWGAWNSISEPEAEFVVRQWERKKAFARRAADLTNTLLSSTLGSRVETAVEEADATATIEIANTLGWERTEVLVLDRVVARDTVVVVDRAGAPIPFQRLASGGLAFRAPRVPGFATTQVRLVRDEEETGDTTERPGVRVEAGSRVVLDNGVLQLGLDPLTGRIVSLRRIDGSGPSRDLVPPGEELLEWLYVPGRDPETALSAGAGSVEVTDAGPLVWRAVVRREAPGTSDGITTTIRLVEGSDRIEFEVRFDKERRLEPEAVLLRFPAALESGSTVRVIGGAWSPFEAESDQAPGANRNYYTVERWADLHDRAGGLTLVSVDAPLVQLGSTGTDPIVAGWRERVDRAPVLFSYLMTNYWETNYRAEQEGPHAIRYVLRPHLGFDVTSAERLGLESAHPLLAYRVRTDLPSLPPPVVVEAEHSVVTLLRRTADSLELRLFNPSGHSDTVGISVPGRPGAAPVRAGFWGPGDGEGSPAGKTLAVRPGEILTVRLPLE
jgi:hypothetical protein